MRPRSRRVKLANRFGLQLLNKAATRFSMSVLGLYVAGAFTRHLGVIDRRGLIAGASAVTMHASGGHVNNPVLQGVRASKLYCIRENKETDQ
jgi:hypothetical protein